MLSDRTVFGIPLGLKSDLFGVICSNVVPIGP